MVQTLTIIDEDGNETQTQVDGKEFSVKLNGEQYSPAVTTEIEIEQDSDNDTTKDMCGNTERQNVGNGGWMIIVQGILTDDEQSPSNLSVQLMRDVLAFEEEIEITSGLISGEFERSNLVITQSEDLVAFHDGGRSHTAYDFQLQLGETESE